MSCFGAWAQLSLLLPVCLVTVLIVEFLRSRRSPLKTWLPLLLHPPISFWWVLAQISGNSWRSFLKAIGKSKVCVFTQLTAFLWLGLFKIKTHTKTLLQTQNCRLNSLLLVLLSQLEEGLEWVLLDQKHPSAANKGKMWLLGVRAEAPCLSAAA